MSRLSGVEKQNSCSRDVRSLSLIVAIGIASVAGMHITSLVGTWAELLVHQILILSSDTGPVVTPLRRMGITLRTADHEARRTGNLYQEPLMPNRAGMAEDGCRMTANLDATAPKSGCNVSK